MENELVTKGESGCHTTLMASPDSQAFSENALDPPHPKSQAGVAMHRHSEYAHRQFVRPVYGRHPVNVNFMPTGADSDVCL